ncbi:hypothetical protein CkaCkLH20_04634 [Colletotrichum karsti]|uniref:Uncharacterized protein n=1 Tax=Colletotrichum karsti TaxID=1095194 RepID=A0A9P6I803_9PEZI|nr:uncharacterized protein CkaCkLH20_04634 [Colletotrichum karsti]KAF9878058.1 hypothetical protein CkaCkLH20_04634 [Colletotrichum karsti]
MVSEDAPVTEKGKNVDHKKAKKVDKNGKPIRRKHDDCYRANYDDDDPVRLCYEGVRGDPECQGYRFCSRGRHCRPPGEFVRAGNGRFMVCGRHNEQSYDTKGKKTGKNSKTRTTTPVARGPKYKGSGTATGRVTKSVTPKKPAAAAAAAARIHTPVSNKQEKKSKKPKKEKNTLFVGWGEDMDDDDEEDEDDEGDEDDLYEEPAARRRRTPEPDNDGSGGMGGGMGRALITV